MPQGRAIGDATSQARAGGFLRPFGTGVFIRGSGRDLMMRDLRVCPFFAAIAMWVQVSPSALAAYEPRGTGIAQDLIEGEEAV